MIENLRVSPVKANGRIVVFGTRGFVGGRLIETLRQQERPVLPLGSAQIDLTAPSSAAQAAALIRSDDVVVVASALTPEKGNDVAACVKNVGMGKHLCAAFAQSPPAQVVYLSSDAVYADDGEPLTEASPCAPSSAYGLAHWVREQLFSLQLRQTRTPLLIVRPCALYGPGDTHRSYGPNRFLKTAREENRIALFGQGEELRDHLHIDDFVRLLLTAVDRRSQGTLNAVPGHAVSFRDVAETVRRHFPSTVLEEAPRAQPIVHRRYDNAALRQAFPAFAFTPLAGGIAACARP